MRQSHFSAIDINHYFQESFRCIQRDRHLCTCKSVITIRYTPDDNDTDRCMKNDYIIRYKSHVKLATKNTIFVIVDI